MLKFKSLNTFLSVLVVALIASSVGALVWYVNTTTYTMALEMGQQTAAQGCEGTVRSIESYLESAEVLASSLAKENIVRNSLQSSYGAGKAFMRLQKVLEARDAYQAVLVFNSHGQIVAGVDSEGNSLAGKDRSAADYVQAILGGQEKCTSASVIKTESGVLVFASACAIMDGAGEVRGGVAVFPRWELFTERFLDPVKVGENGYGFILDATGKVIGHGADKSLIMTDLSDEPFIQKAREIGSGELWYEWDGERKLMSVRTVELSGWLVAVSELEDEIAATAIIQRNTMIGAGIGMILLVAGGIVLLVRRYALKPLTTIEQFSGRVAEGDLSAELDGTYRFEFKGLAEHVHAMVAELKQKLGFAEGVLQGITLPCAVADAQNRIVFTNQAMCDYLEQHDGPQAQIGKTSGELVFRDSSRMTISQKALEEQKRLEQEARVSLPSGRSIVASVTSTPFYDMDGNILGTIAIWFDLTDIREQEERIRAQHDRLAHAAVDASDVSSMVSSSAEELAAQVEQSNAGAEEQQQRTAEVATAMDEMNATVLEVARNADNAAGMAEQVRERAQEGAKVVEESVQISTRVTQQSESLSASMAELGRQAEAVGQVITVIEDIADQTNLLALNAAIEAARAGDAGRGFAVVADEVRKLAERTMAATKEVTQSVTLIQRSADENVRGSAEAARAVEESRQMTHRSGEVLAEIISLVDKTADQVRAIATAAEEQSATSEQIAQATEGINAIAGETTTAMTESTRAIQGLAEQAARLQTIIADMRSEQA